MKVKFIQCLSGADFCHNPGDEVEVADAQAVRLIEAGIAIPMKDVGKLETATQSDAANEIAVAPDVTPQGK